MKAKSILKQLLFPMIAIAALMAVLLTTVIVAVFTNSYASYIDASNIEKSNLMAGEIAAFMDGAYGITEELSVNPSILTMDTATQTPILEDCVARNPYLELLYIQRTACRPDVLPEAWQTVLQDGGLYRPWKKSSPLFPSHTTPSTRGCPVLPSFFPCTKEAV